MRGWSQEIELILKGDLKGAAQVYGSHRPDLTAQAIVEDVAKAMGVVVKKFEEKEKSHERV